MKLTLFKPTRTCELLLGASSEHITKLDIYALEMEDYKKGNTPPEGEYLPLRLIDDKIRRYWIKADFRTPKEKKDHTYALELVTGIGGSEAQVIVYLNGYMAQGMDGNHRRVTLEPDTDYHMDCYLYSGQPWAHYPIEFDLIKINKRVGKLYFDMVTPLEACRDVYPEGSAEYMQTLSVLEGACNILDMRVGSDAFYESVEKAIEYMEEEFYGKLCSREHKPEVECVAHTHIDVEWMWDRYQTKEKMQRSISTALALMKEYPFYRFMLSQPELYGYLKEEAPEKYDELKEYIKEGRFEPEGALYLECDCNLTSGESIVRQLLYGKKFFKEEFGIDSRICFLPDVFGYSAALPQILKKSGVDYFVTSKISWNDTNTFPYDAFIWQGMDGSEIFTAFITGQIYNKDKRTNRRTAYGSGLDASFIKGAWERFQQKEFCSTALFTFGHGDGGGGPTYQMLEKGKRLEKGLPGMPKANFNLLRPALDKMYAQFTASAERLRFAPRWVGELYLELHRGTYTSQARTKRNNRKAELAVSRLEALSVLDMPSYPKEAIDGVWYKMLHNQFHDILPGSSIEEVYKLVDRDYEEIFETIEDETDRKLTALAGRISTEGGILVYNPLGFDRKAGADEVIPAFGYKVIKPSLACRNAIIEGNRAENERYILTLDQSGRISCLYDKKACREVLDGLGNEFRVYEDFPCDHDAWDMEEYTETKGYTLDGKAEITALPNGFRIVKRYMDSTIEQTLNFKGERIDLHHRIDWHEDHHILKLHFPINVHASEVACDVQFGHIRRPTHRNTSWDAAKFEICAHKWVDVSEYGYGAALLNDCKYGHSVDGSEIKLTCIKCPTEPAANADIGEHVFSCSLFPHMGDFRKAGVIKEAYSFNQPLIYKEIEANEGDMPESYSFVSCDNDAVVVETVKKAENEDAVVIRTYEAFGGSTKCTLSFGESYSKAYICDLMENESSEIEIKNNSVELSFRAFEIVTIKLYK